MIVDQNLVADRLHLLVVAKQVKQQFLVLRLKHFNLDSLEIWNVDLISSDLETLHVAEHGECLPCAHVFPDLVVLMDKQLVKQIIVLVLA